MTIAEQLINRGVQQGMQQGMQQGILEGIVEGKLKVARVLLKKGYAWSAIAEVTELSVEQLQSYLKDSTK